MATHLLPAPPVTLNLNPLTKSSSSSSRCSLSTSFLSPSVLGNDFSGHSIRTPFRNPPRDKRAGHVTMVIPFQRGSIWERPPPDLASYIFKNRIVYLGMCLVPAVTELIVAEFLYLNWEDEKKPIYFYINSTGTTKNGVQLGYEAEAFGIYDSMSYVKAPIFTLCVGNAWGEAALLLASGAKGNRSALQSATIMMKQPTARFQGQATDVENKRREVRHLKATMVKLYSRSIGKSPEEIEADIRRPKYFSPTEAVEYGIIDKVLYNEKGREGKGVMANLRSSNLI